MTNFLFIFLIIAVSCIGGYHSKLLTKSGSFAALLTGLAVGAGFGFKGLLMLGFFFASSSFWSKFKQKNKAEIEQRHEKGSQRDWQQVAANGGTAAFFSLLYAAFPDPIWLIGFSISLAAANSDTWASEIGSLSKRPPIFVRTFKRIESGTSGAISLLGTFAALCGSLTLAFLGSFLFNISIYATLMIALFGFLGNAVDTIFGACLQAVYRCSVCNSEVEALKHCGKKTELIRGNAKINNDFVNFSSGLIAALAGVLFFYKL